ncbi:MAG: hypothetical protein ACOY82_11300 [Pseudomonadota bacterium]
MRKWLKRLAWTAMALFIILGSLWAISRWRGPTDAQAAALAVIREPIPPLQGSNAFPPLWQLPYAIPEAEREAVFAEDVRRMRSGSRADAATAVVAMLGTSVAEGRYPASTPTEVLGRFCNLGEDCLKKVSADRAGYAELVARYAALLDRADALRSHAGVRQSFGYHYGAPMPAFQYARLPLTRQALLFLSGERDAAMDAACRSVSTWRRLGSDSDSLISRLIGVAAVDAHGRLFAQMLAETPRDAALPASCVAAFAPPSGLELSICRAVRGEFALTDTVIAAVPDDPALLDAWWSRRMPSLFFDPTMSAADIAEPYAYHCRSDAARAMAEDARVDAPEKERGLLRLECVSNLQGCILGDIATPDFDDYAARVQDSNAQLRLVGLLLKLRGEAGDARPFEARLRDEAAAIGASARAPTLTADGTAVRIRNSSTSRGEFRELPLPAYFRVGDGASR